MKKLIDEKVDLWESLLMRKIDDDWGWLVMIDDNLGFWWSTDRRTYPQTDNAICEVAIANEKYLRWTLNMFVVQMSKCHKFFV